MFEEADFLFCLSKVNRAFFNPTHLLVSIRNLFSSVLVRIAVIYGDEVVFNVQVT